MKIHKLNETLMRISEDGYAYRTYNIKDVIDQCKLKKDVIRIIYDNIEKVYIIGDGLKYIHYDLYYKAYESGVYDELIHQGEINPNDPSIYWYNNYADGEIFTIIFKGENAELGYGATSEFAKFGDGYNYDGMIVTDIGEFYFRDDNIDYVSNCPLYKWCKEHELKNAKPEFVIDDGNIIEYNGTNKNITIPKNVDYIEFDVFIDCDLHSVEFEKREDKFLYISDSAFENNNIKKLILPNNIGITDKSFANNDLEYVSVGHSLQSYGDVFEDNPRLKYIYYRGTKEDWDKQRNKDEYIDLLIEQITDIVSEETGETLYSKNENENYKRDDKMKTINEKHYGGAFDINDEEYFTRDDINEFAYNVEDKMNEKCKDCNFTFVSTYLDDEMLEVTMECDGFEERYRQKIDMRKIHKPKDLSKYEETFVNNLLSLFEKDGFECEDNIEEDYNNNIEKIASKMIKDVDGFTTDYIWYKDSNGNNFFMFGDEEYTEPDIDYADWVTDSDKQAKEWFDNYDGFDSIDD